MTTLGKKGPIQSLMTMMKDLSPEEKPAFGQEVNECKKAVAAAIEVKMAVLEKAAMNRKLEEEKIDITLPGVPFRTGTLHPLTLISQEIEDLFIGMGYTCRLYTSIKRTRRCGTAVISIRKDCRWRSGCCGVARV